MENKNRYVPSRFNAITHTDDNGVVLFNSYTGAITYFSDQEKQAVLSSLKRAGTELLENEIQEDLHTNGFLVSSHVDEKRRAQFLHQSLHRTDTMHLVLMPTEACNFRCTYCYETFERGKMNRTVINGLKAFVQEKAASLTDLHISWFGGEPLISLDVIEELSETFLAIAKENHVQYSCDLVTNEYLLTKDTFQRLLSWNINQFMITVDGVGEVHDRRRHLTGGGRTFDTIIENLIAIKDVPGSFDITIRTNFDEDNLQATSELTHFLKDHFADDKRFGILFRPVGQWGGKNDDDIPVCSRTMANKKIWELTDEAISQGFGMSSMITDSLMPSASVCYAAKPHSLVVSSHGQLYKCTLSLHEEFNQVGKIHEDGHLELDYDKIASWVTSGEETDAVCQSCFYRPVCQGNHCPLYRMRTGERPCPYEKRNIKKVLNLIWKNSTQ
ncbi:radical SAM protein [Neobacillus sp. MM2021_6]|uniref:radical SAM/SPASM domain-containing protein n=1 Tax=Bacillaceae TaxID=186817 RepID=UPI00140BA8EC|nr:MULTISPECIES: radical SAM protein [Bacillaceae]MBO0959326.1 radical SAM protein [Neobacillus sp. MM2021_6]NHC19725.1 radical SAM protein [Bacillus sp. MM2020_4]